ncbi:MAG: OmpH family outer membrane protein [Phycisphaerae bacterium]
MRRCTTEVNSVRGRWNPVDRRHAPLIAGLLVIALAVAATTVPAQEPNRPADLRSVTVTPAPTAGTGVVDLIRIFNECRQIMDLNDVFRQTRRELSDEATLKQKRLEELEIKLRAYRPDSPDYPGARKELSDETIGYRVWFETKQAELRADEMRWMKHLYEEANEVVRQLAQRRGLAMVVQSERFNATAAQDDLAALQAQIRSRKVVYAHPSTDITADVIAEMDQRYEGRGAKQSLGAGRTAAAAPPPTGSEQP